MLVCWAHGKESGPWGNKIASLCETARDEGFKADSLDYRGMMDPEQRVARLMDYLAQQSEPVILAGSSMGGYVSLVAACRRPVKGLFLLAPAIFLPGFPGTGFTPQTRSVAIVHGWRDEVIPPENSFRLAKEITATLHLVDGDHRLRENIEELKVYFSHFLKDIREKENSGKKT